MASGTTAGTGAAQARQERDEAQARFQITFDANPAPSMIVRLADQRVLEANPGLPEITGRPNAEVKGRRIPELTLFSNRDAGKFERIVENLRQGEATSKETLAVCSSSQGERVVQVSAKAIELDAGACGIFTFADVTELEHAQELFGQVFRLAPVPITLIDSNQHFTEVNESFEVLTGYARSEVVGRTNSELQLWSSPEDRRHIRDALGAQGEFHNLDLSLRTKAGDERHVIGSAKPLTVAGERILLHIFYDVTARKRTESEMHRAIQSVMNDTTWFSRSLIEQLNRIHGGEEAETLEQVALSRREQEVLEHLAQGLSNQDIAAALGLARQTVRNYIAVIYSKLNVHSRVEAVVWARERGLI